MPVVKIPPDNAGNIRDSGLIPGSGRFPGGGHSNQLQYSFLENPMDKEAWKAQSIGLQRVKTQLKRLSTAQIMGYIYIYITSAVDFNVLMDISSNSFFNGQVISPV